MEIRTIGIDLGKTVFHFVAVNARGQVVVRRKGSRAQLLRFTANLPQCLIGMEACGGAHFLGRALREQGHDVRLMPAQYVKPYVKTNKNDYIDAEACSEAVTRPRMRFVPIKTDDQLDLQSLHRVRERWVVRRTAVINQMRGMLLERGITIRKGRHYIEESLPAILEDADNKLSGALRVLLTQLRMEMQYLHGQIEETDKLIARICGELERVPAPGRDPRNRTDHSHGHSGCHRQRCRLQEGPWLFCLAGRGARRALHRRQAKADRHQQTGNKYLRKLFVQGAHTVLLAEDQAIFRLEYVAG
jgi:transposase